MFAGASSGGGFHGSQPNPNDDDANFVIIESANGASYLTPVTGQNEVFAMSPTAVAPIVRFGQTDNSGTSAGFACGAGIGFPSQDGNWWFYLSDGLLNLGLDSGSNPLCSIFAKRLQ